MIDSDHCFYLAKVNVTQWPSFFYLGQSIWTEIDYPSIFYIANYYSLRIFDRKFSVNAQMGSYNYRSMDTDEGVDCVRKRELTYYQHLSVYCLNTLGVDHW